MQQQLAAADMARQTAQAEANQLRFQSGEATHKVSNSTTPPLTAVFYHKEGLL
jgi:hypothetical protein